MAKSRTSLIFYTNVYATDYNHRFCKGKNAIELNQVRDKKRYRENDVLIKGYQNTAFIYTN